MSNQDIEAALTYHEATKLSYINLLNKPPLYKPYIGLPVLPLPTDFPPPEAPTLDAVATVDPPIVPPSPGGLVSLDLTTLAQLLFFSAGLVRKGVFPVAGEVHFRAAASAGALYPVEVYLVCKDIPAVGASRRVGTPLQAGVYHFSPEDFTLHQLRRGDYRGELSSAAGGDRAIATAPATLIFTAIFWRSAWKYRARSYRYCFWDNGTILANLLATAGAASLPAQVVAGFVDERVNRLLGVREEREASLCLVPIGKEDDPPPASGPLDLSPLSAEAVGPASEEVDYPEIRHLHAATSLSTEEQVSAWRGVLLSPPLKGQGPYYPLQPLEPGAPRPVGAAPLQVPSRLGDVVLGRGSTRRFAPDPISRSQFSSILGCSTRGVPADFLGPGGASLLDIYIIVNAVQGLPAGSYFFSPQTPPIPPPRKRGMGGLELLQEGGFRQEAGHLCFEQALGADASAVVFFMSDLERVLRRYGSRGYRAAQLEAGILGGKMYLCAHSLGLGASGLTFYDDEVTDFFSPHAQGKSTMFVVALGVPARRNRVRPFRSQVGVVLDALARGAVRGT